MNIKRIKGLLLLIVIMICIVPIKVNAAALTTSVSKQKIAPNQEVTVNVQAAGFQSTFGTITFSIKYDATKFDYVSSKSVQGLATSNPSAGALTVVIRDTAGMNNGALFQMVLKSKSTADSGDSTIQTSVTDCWTTDASSEITVTQSSVKVTHFVASTDNTLKSLSVSGCTLNPAFDKDVTNYTCPNTDASSVTITALANDAGAKVTGSGTKTLSYGSNKISVIVTSESGSSKTYYINIGRNDSRDSDSSLKDLVVEGYNIDFNPSKFNYTIDVDNTVETINIRAEAVNSTTRINGIGVKKLTTGTNEFKVVAIAQNNDTRTYTITVNKADKENVPSNELESIEINNKVINITDNHQVIGVNKTVTDLELKVNTKSKTATYEISGDKGLKPGINIVTITVKEENFDDEEYILIVYKDEFDNISSINSLKELNKNISTDSNNTINETTMNILKDNPYNINIQSKDTNGGLLYNVELNKDVNVTGDIKINLVKVNEIPLTYASNVPAGANIKLFVDPSLITSKTVYLYSFNQQTNEYILINENLEINDYYASFTSTGAGTYIISETAINQTKAPVKTKSDLPLRLLFLVIGIIIGVVGTILFQKIPKKNKPTVVNRDIERL